MSFFEPPRVAPSWSKPSEGVLFGVVPFRAVVARTAEVCIFVDRVRADVDGLIVDLELHLAETLDDDRHVDGLFPWGITPIPSEPGAGPWNQHIAPGDQMFFGVVLSDGGKAVAKTREEIQQEIRESHSDVDETTAPSWIDQSAPAPPTITAMGGSGGGTESKSAVWVYTGENADSVTLVVEWPVFDISETEVTIPGELIAIGRKEIETLW